MAKTGVIEKDSAMVIKATELKKELRRLVNIIVDEEREEDARVEVYDRAIETLLALKDCKFKKKSSFKIEQLDVPSHFRCPLSNELMRDPVILSTGQTYERHFIRARLDEGKRTCPQTQQVLEHTNLIPNNLVRELISKWCKNQGLELPKPGNDSFMQGITEGEKDRFNALVEEIVSATLPEQKKAAKELRSLTKRFPSFRTLFYENSDAIPKLLHPLKLSRDSCPPDLEEDLVTTVLNLSILDDNKKLVAETEGAISLLIESLEKGSMETRSNAAAALFTLSALESNKALIGLAGAIKPLIALLNEGNSKAMKDAASALYNLCNIPENKMRAVRDGAVKVLMQKLKGRILVDELLTILALLSGHEKSIKEMCELGAVSFLLSIMRETTCGRSKENCIAVLYMICSDDRSKLKEIRDEERTNGTISELAETGTSRARRKAYSILEKFNRSISRTHTA